MTLCKRKSSQASENIPRFSNEPYLIINIILAGVILLIFAYSGIFSPEKDNYPVVCIHEKLSGEPCVSCGLSHSFSLIIRGKISEAYEWNVYGLRIFLFFALQLVMRSAFSLFYIRYADTRKQLIIFDITGSAIILLIAFYPFISRIF
ncbi:MAG TPA: DUF2752 domain-containing protein [Bacteroidales bacterium]|nr:DUF2752 domain-containing protein [Bacteroidales bacterium]